MPPEGGVLTLEELHDIIKEVWLTRHDAELEAEQAARRKGRPKSVKEMKLEEIKLQEAEDYRTGMGKIMSWICFLDTLTQLISMQRSSILHMRRLSSSFGDGIKENLPTSRCFASSGYPGLIRQSSLSPNRGSTILFARMTIQNHLKTGIWI
jgi:hypothetical protein